MGRRLTVVSTMLFTLSIVSVSAQKSYNVVGTGQAKFYNNQAEIAEPKKGEPFYGQDAQFVGNRSNYTDNGDGTVTDNVTGLMWQKDYQVTSFDEALRIAQDTMIAGYSDWRLPTIKEGYSLIMFYGVDASTASMTSTPEGAIPFIDTHFFDFVYGSNGTRPIDTQMISSTEFIGSSAQRPFVFGVNLADGRIKAYPKISRGVAKMHTVRLVRGADYGVNAFRDNQDGTISDEATGLMWSKNDSQKGLNWEEALAYASAMNERNYLGYNDWRVPDIKELQSIVDYSRSPETSSSAAIDPIFEISEIQNEANVVDYPFFWSSTTHCAAGARNSASAADYISFGRALGNMSNMSMGQSTNRTNGVANRSQGQGQTQQRRASMQGQGQQGQNQQRQAQNSNSTKAANWVNIHGAGAQRSDPKSGDPTAFANGRGPQGDAIRIYNYVRLVRDIR